MSDGMECPECGVEHTDWSFDGQHAVADEHNQGVIKRYECGRCNAVAEVAYR